MCEFIELIKEIDELVDNIEKYCFSYFEVHSSDMKSDTVHLIASISSVIPQIIALYDIKGISLQAEGKAYWTGELKRMLRALESQDIFEKWDVFQMETVISLNQMKNFLEEKQNVGN